MIFTSVKVMAIGVVVAFVGGLVAGSSFVSIHYKNKNLKAEIAYANALASYVEQARKTEHILNETKAQLEERVNEDQRKISDLHNKYTAAVAAGKRLRDPGAKSACGVPRDSSPSSNSTKEGAGGELSLEANDFLLSEAARADRINAELELCKSWVREVQIQVNSSRAKK